MTDGLRINRLTLFGSYGTNKTYSVDFSKGGEWRPLSIIAGRSATGKSSVIEYILYCLGDKDYPTHVEMRDTVAGAALDLEISGAPVRIERTTAGAASKFASVWFGSPDDPDVTEERRTIEPPSDEQNLSHLVMAGFGLAGIKLPMSQSRADTATQTFTIRDVIRLFHLPNSRLDSKNLLFEEGNYVVAQKFSQAVDLAFGVADASISEIADRLRDAEAAVREADARLTALNRIVDQEYPEGPAGVEILAEDARKEVGTLRQRVRDLDADATRRTAEVEALRTRLHVARRASEVWSLKVRDRKSLLARLDSLRLDYADDLRKFVFLKEAERVFDPFAISVCPVCLNPLEHSVLPIENHCGLCGHVLNARELHEHNVDSDLIQRENRAIQSRLEALVEYLERLQREARVFERNAASAGREVSSAEAAVEAAANLPAPFLAARDSLSDQVASASAQLERNLLGSRLWARVARSTEERDRLLATAAAIRRERSELLGRPDRGEVIRKLSERFAGALRDFGYPKLADAYIDEKLVPHVRGSVYTAASSGGLTLISLAWYLAVWEVGYETSANLPGLLLVDSPQKNLGARADSADPEFSDLTLVDGFYRHISSWLSGAGQGAQIIIVDNTPPAEYAEDVVVRFSGTVGVEPFGLISDAIE